MGWLAGYSFKKMVLLPAMTADQINLNYEIQVAWQSGMNADFSDIRFTDSDEETLLYQYRDRYTASTIAYFWIKVPSILLAGKTIYMYFGNSSAADVSDGVNTFSFFDDFSGDLSKWTCFFTTIVDGKMEIAGDSSRAKNIGTWGNGYGTRFSMAVIKGNMAYNQPERYAGWGNFVDGIWASYYFIVNSAFAWKANFVSPTDNQSYAATACNENYDIYQIDKITSKKIKTYFNYVLEKEFISESTINTSDSCKIISFRHYTTSYPSGYKMKVDWIYIYKLPQDGTIIDILIPGTDTYLSKINRERKIAYEQTNSIWGTAVAPGSGDQILVKDLRGLIEGREILFNKASGYAWNEAFELGRKLIEPEIEAQLRYSGRQWSFVAQLMGLDSLAGADPYEHKMILLDQIDGSDLFGSLYAVLGMTTVGLRFEWPSVKPKKISIFGPDEHGYVSIIAGMIADHLKYGSDCAFTISDMSSVTHLQLNGGLPPAIPFGCLRFRANNFADSALGSNDIIPVKKFQIDLERRYGQEFTGQGSVNLKWSSAEPIESGIPIQKLTIDLGDLAFAWLESFQDETIKKADLYFQLDANYNLLIQYPALKVEKSEPTIVGDQRIGQRIEMLPMKVSAAPDGMSCTNWQIILNDANGTAYE